MLSFIRKYCKKKNKGLGIKEDDILKYLEDNLENRTVLYEYDSFFLESTLAFFKEFEEVGIDYKRIQQIDSLGIYVFSNKVEVYKQQIIEGVFRGEEYIEAPFDINTEYYLFNQIRLKDFNKNIVIGYYSPVGYDRDMGINWGKVIPHFYKIEEVKGAVVRYKFK